MVRTRRLCVALRGPSLPRSGHGALAGRQRTVMVRTGGLRVSKACVLRWAWVCTHQHAGRNFLCQVPFERGGTWSGSARSVKKNATQAKKQEALAIEARKEAEESARQAKEQE